MTAGTRQQRSARPGDAGNRVELPGFNRAIIAIVDSGFDLRHPNLNYVDRALHFNAEEYLLRRRGKLGSSWRGPYDASFGLRSVPHGTSVAGAAAGRRRDARDPALDSPAPGFPVMPIKVRGNRNPPPDQVVAAIHWAVEHDARVINFSFKVAATPALVAAIEFAWERGLVLCAAAGNYSKRYPFHGVDFPARHPRVIAVGAIDRRGRRKRPYPRLYLNWGSQYGDELDVVARGVEVRSLDDLGVFGALPGDFAQHSAGTSIAAPQVAGLAALLIGARPELTNQQVRDIIEGTAIKLAGYQFRQVPGRKWRWNREVGYGLVDRASALKEVSGGRDERDR